MIRILLVVLCVLFVVLYAASMLHFPTRYANIEDYLRAHGIYWVAMAVTAFSIWVVEAIRRRRDR
jgi:VanZ family protein